MYIEQGPYCNLMSGGVAIDQLEFVFATHICFQLVRVLLLLVTAIQRKLVTITRQDRVCSPI